VKLILSRSESIAGTNHDVEAPGTFTNVLLVVVVGLFSIAFRTPLRAPPEKAVRAAPSAVGC
jgi:hypothetical protein